MMCFSLFLKAVLPKLHNSKAVFPQLGQPSEHSPTRLLLAGLSLQLRGSDKLKTTALPRQGAVSLRSTPPRLRYRCTEVRRYFCSPKRGAQKAPAGWFPLKGRLDRENISRSFTLIVQDTRVTEVFKFSDTPFYGLYPKFFRNCCSQKGDPHFQIFSFKSQSLDNSYFP